MITRVNGQVFTIKVFQHSPSNRHMMWHQQFRQTEKPQDDHWYHDAEENLMKEYIRRHYDESALAVLEELRRDAVYGCSDPRMHVRDRAQVTKLTNDATERQKEDFETLHQTIDDYVTEHGCIPCCVILQLLTMRYFGAVLLDTDFIDKDYAYRSSKSFSCMFWNLGNWQRSRLLKNPLPEHVEKYRRHINFDFDSDHKLISDKPLYNNFFVNVVKNLRTHLFMNCEATSILNTRKGLKEVATLCASTTTKI